MCLHRRRGVHTRRGGTWKRDEPVSTAIMQQSLMLLRTYPIRAILRAMLLSDGARYHHVHDVRAGSCVLSVIRLAEPIIPTGIGSMY